MNRPVVRSDGPIAGDRSLHAMDNTRSRRRLLISGLCSEAEGTHDGVPFVFRRRSWLFYAMGGPASGAPTLIPVRHVGWNGRALGVVEIEIERVEFREEFELRHRCVGVRHLGHQVQSYDIH